MAAILGVASARGSRRQARRRFLSCACTHFAQWSLCGGERFLFVNVTNRSLLQIIVKETACITINFTTQQRPFRTKDGYRKAGTIDFAPTIQLKGMHCFNAQKN